METIIVKQVKFPVAAITIAVGQYYMDRHKTIKTSINYVTGPDGKNQTIYLACKGETWDKQSSLKRITDACNGKWSWECCAGTFYFYRFFKNGKQSKVYTINEKTWPLAE